MLDRLQSSKPFAMGSITIKPSLFDNRVTGQRIAIATVFTDLDKRESAPNDEAFDLLCSKIASDDLEATAILDRSGFRYVEGEVDLELSLEPLPSFMETRWLRQANHDDLNDLKKLMSESMRGLTRFRGPWFTTEESEKMYEACIENAVHGQFDHVCLVKTNEENQFIGFITIRWLSNAEAWIGFFAVAKGSRRGGVGAELFEYAKRFYMNSGRKKLFIATQTRNVPALGLYQRRGGLVISTAHWYCKQPSHVLSSSDRGHGGSDTAKPSGASVLSRPHSGRDSLDMVKEMPDHGSLAGNGKFTREYETSLTAMYGHARVL